MLRQVIARKTRGDIGLRVEIWRMATQDHVRCVEIDYTRRALEAKAFDTRRGAAILLLRQCMSRLMRGEVGMRIEVWRSQLLKDVHVHVHTQTREQLMDLFKL